MPRWKIRVSKSEQIPMTEIPKRKPRLVRMCVLLLAGFSCVAVSLRAEEPPLKYVTAVASDELKGVVSIDISSDGRFAYSANYLGKSVCAFSRDAQTGGLTRIDAITDAGLFDGVTAVRLSPDNRFAITAAFRSKASVLLSRDAKTGRLKMVDAVEQGKQTPAQLEFAVDAAWSPDSAFAYVIAPNGAAVNVFHISAKPALEFVEAELGQDRCFWGARGIALSPDGKFVYVASEYAGTLTVLNRDAQTGKLDVHQILRDGNGKAEGLSGAFSLSVSPDGRFVYLSSGRFRGNDAISIFEKQKDGRLALVDEMFNYTDKLERFVGGNEIIISQDGKYAYAVGSRSDSLVAFDRDPQTGKLKQTQYLVDGNNGVGPMVLPGGLTVSPDGRFVYVASEGSSAITIFEQTTPRPAIAEKPKR